jgi:hypothetical protein
VKLKVYVHADRDYMWTKGEELGLKGGALSMFSHAASDIEVILEVDTNGRSTILAADGRTLGELFT